MYNLPSEGEILVWRTVELLNTLTVIFSRHRFIFSPRSLKSFHRVCIITIVAAHLAATEKLRCCGRHLQKNYSGSN